MMLAGQYTLPQPTTTDTGKASIWTDIGNFFGSGQAEKVVDSINTTVKAGQDLLYQLGLSKSPSQPNTPASEQFRSGFISGQTKTFLVDNWPVLAVGGLIVVVLIMTRS